MRKIRVVVFTGLSMASIACGTDSTGPASIPSNAMNGLYIGSTSKADIRLQVAYGVVANSCAGLSGNDRVLCLLFPENLYGSGSITLRETGEVQSFQLTGIQAVAIGMTFHPQSGVMLGTRLSGSMSSQGTTLEAKIYPGLATPQPWIFGDSAAVTFVRQ